MAILEAALLPKGFEGLEPLVANWVLDDTLARIEKRRTSSIEYIREFYDAMLPMAEKALEYLQGYALGDLPPEGERLLKLMLSLAEVAPAVEWYNSPDVYDGFDLTRLRFPVQMDDTAAQS